MLRSKLLGKPGSRTYARVTIENRYVAPVNTAPGSGILSSMTKADGFVIIPENVEGYDEGQQVEVILFE
jgi:molybdopterin molybdotransferase